MELYHELSAAAAVARERAASKKQREGNVKFKTKGGQQSMEVLLDPKKHRNISRVQVPLRSIQIMLYQYGRGLGLHTLSEFYISACFSQQVSRWLASQYHVGDCSRGSIHLIEGYTKVKFHMQGKHCIFRDEPDDLGCILQKKKEMMDLLAEDENEIQILDQY